MRGRHRKGGPLRLTRRASAIASAETQSVRRVLGGVLVATVLAVSGTAIAADEPTTTTTTIVEEESTTTTVESSTTTVVESSTTTTTNVESSTTTIVESTTTTTIPTETTTTVPSTPVDDSDDHNPEPDADDFRVGTRTPPAIVFPVAGPHSFVNTFGADRDGGRRRHEGIDIIAGKGIPIVAVADGVVVEVSTERLAGQYVIVRHDDGWVSKYLHLDDDSPGTDDGLRTGYAAGIEVGVRVTAGTLLGFNGDSGNAESTTAHLHFGLYQPGGLPVNPYWALVGAPDVETVTISGGVRTSNTELVGHLDPDLRGFNAGIAIAEDHVYIGSWGTDEVCPGTGVRVVDVSDPAEPVRVTSFADEDEFPGTATDRIWVGAVHTPGFGGDVAVVSLRTCDGDVGGSEFGQFAGFAIYSVNDPENPVLLSSVHSGEGTHGASDVDVRTVDGRVLAVVTVPGSYLDHEAGLGDVRVYDLTDLKAVVELSDWDVRSDGPTLLADSLTARGGDSSLSARSASWSSPDRVVVAQSAAGLVTLDVSDPESPVQVDSVSGLDTFDLVFGGEPPTSPTVEAHDGWVLADSVLVQDDQRLEPTIDEFGEPMGWSQQVIYDVTDRASPRPVATFGTERSKVGADEEVGLDGFYGTRGSQLYRESYELVTWASDGVRIVDLRDPTEPTEVGYFIPPPRPDAHGWWVAPDGNREMPLAWDAVVSEGLVYLSDVNSGLWVFRVDLPVQEGSLPAPE